MPKATQAAPFEKKAAGSKAHQGTLKIASDDRRGAVGMAMKQPTDDFDQETYENALAEIVSVLGNHTLLGYQNTRLTEQEIAQILSHGTQVSEPDHPFAIDSMRPLLADAAFGSFRRV